MQFVSLMQRIWSGFEVQTASEVREGFNWQFVLCREVNAGCPPQALMPVMTLHFICTLIHRAMAARHSGRSFSEQILRRVHTSPPRRMRIAFILVLAVRVREEFALPSS